MLPPAYSVAAATARTARRALPDSTAHTARTTHSAPVPSHTSRNAGVGARRLIHCIAAIPAGASARARPSMTNAEKAKKTPALRPQPSAVARVRRSRAPCIAIVAPPSAEEAEARDPARGGGQARAAPVAGRGDERREQQPLDADPQERRVRLLVVPAREGREVEEVARQAAARHPAGLGHRADLGEHLLHLQRGAHLDPYPRLLV